MNQTFFNAITAFECKHCEAKFGVNTQISECNCPNCLNKCKYLGEGFMTYNQMIQIPNVVSVTSDNDELLTAEDIAEIIGISKRVAYEIMDESDFPLIRIRRYKRVLKSDFFEWVRKNRVDSDE